MVVVQAQVVVQVVVDLGAKLLANDVARQTRLPERDHQKQRDPQQETGEGWP